VDKLADDTAIVIQAPQNFQLDLLPPGPDWEMRRYGQTNVVIGQTRKESVVSNNESVTKEIAN
jgi:hypothetical protein